MKSIIEVWDFVKDKEYHSKLFYGIKQGILLIDNCYFSDFSELFEDIDLWESELTLYFKGTYFCVYVEDMLNLINPEYTEEIIGKLEESSRNIIEILKRVEEKKK